MKVAARRRELRGVYQRLDDADRQRYGGVRRIARTETIGALNGSAYSGAWVPASGERWWKQWLATDDERARPTHHHADGQIVPIEGDVRGRWCPTGVPRRPERPGRRRPGRNTSMVSSSRHVNKIRSRIAAEMLLRRLDFHLAIDQILQSLLQEFPGVGLPVGAIEKTHCARLINLDQPNLPRRLLGGTEFTEFHAGPLQVRRVIDLRFRRE
ncbi:hypothetical protein FXF69_39785 [Actinomadura chibensis]|uniref:Uncharacterized protein n=1 Tax=Actinomadura chibensis TaxID=392828 RepID=A0A5D0N6V9_9ACTN|nr:hypothetical protein FXF69_39785 [Actinomadura chibensis]